MKKKETKPSAAPFLFFLIAAVFFLIYLSLPDTKTKRPIKHDTDIPVTALKKKSNSPLYEKMSIALKDQPNLIPYLNSIQNINYSTQVKNDRLNDLIKTHLNLSLFLDPHGVYQIDALTFGTQQRGDKKVIVQLSISDVTSKNIIGEINIETDIDELQEKGKKKPE